LQLYALGNFPMVQPGDDLFALLQRSLQDNDRYLAKGDVLVIAQKIVSKAEDRYVDLVTVTPSAKALELAEAVDKDPRLVELILRESREVVRCKPGVVIVEHLLGYVHANAGIDRSNVEGGDTMVLLLPKDPDASAASLRQRIAAELGVDVAIIINDSAGRAWREGAIGFALGSAGFEPVVDLVGSKDLLGRPMQVTTVAVADELAAAASFLMGQSDEGVPVVLVCGANLRSSSAGSGSLIRARAADLFR
jgi:coenzyme F420-0:L-glutamate ligase/coenzyme F420-1:gamma-L-glutamate ligase